LVPTDRQWHFPRPADQPGSLALLEARLYRYPGSKEGMGYMTSMG
jgi:hypothetical protein